MTVDWGRWGGIGCLVAVGPVAYAGRARGHVDYVTDGGSGGDTGELFRTVLTDPMSAGLLVGGALAVVALVIAYLRFASAVPDVEVARRTLRAYKPYLPWMLRLSVGLPLVGAGFAGYLFSPSVAVDARLLQVGIGFLLLFGLATRLVALVGLGAYLLALATDATLLLASEYVAGFLAIAIVGPGQPSADMLLHRLIITDGTVASRFRDVPTPDDLLARVGVDELSVAPTMRLFIGLNFVYLGVAQKWLNVEQSLAVVAKYDLTAVVPVSPELWVFGAGLVEAAVGVFLLTGTLTRGAAAAAFVILTTTLFGLPDDPVLAHVTLFGLSSALMVTGAGRFSLDTAVLPELHRRLGAGTTNPDPSSA
jgi:uncharacterized membrane protein YphA (DoxX/SURF4 family)